jgi:hypothetical protein
MLGQESLVLSLYGLQSIYGAVTTYLTSGYLPLSPLRCLILVQRERYKPNIRVVPFLMDSVNVIVNS